MLKKKFIQVKKWRYIKGGFTNLLKSIPFPHFEQLSKERKSFDTSLFSNTLDLTKGCLIRGSPALF